MTKHTKKRRLITRVCVLCKTKYKTRASHAKFCTKECRSKVKAQKEKLRYKKQPDAPLTTAWDRPTRKTKEWPKHTNFTD